MPARKVILPCYIATEVCAPTDTGAEAITIPMGEDVITYFARPRCATNAADQINSRPSLTQTNYNLYPVVLDQEGAPWAEAMTFLHYRLEDTINPNVATFSGIADDLAAFRRFLDENEIDWTSFPTHKPNRPTYRYNAHLRIAVMAGEIAASTAKRRMSTVISFYSWLESEEVLHPENPPWKSSDRYINIKDGKGMTFSKKVKTTDVTIKLAKQVDPYTDTIEDGGQLRPLSPDEQVWVLNAAVASGNTEMTLIHLFGLLTGARIQSILTMRVRHVFPPGGLPTEGEVRIPIGPGTGIDTKNNKRLVLHIPVELIQMLQVYAVSERAKKRRSRANGGDTTDQYLFISVRGTPLYQSKTDRNSFNPTNSIRHAKVGQAVRQFMSEKVIPYVRQNHAKGFRYRFHDTRASYGMNLTDHQLQRVARGEISLHQAREFVKTRLGHESSATTDNYLNYRNNLPFIREVANNYHTHLSTLIQKIWRGM